MDFLKELFDKAENGALTYAEFAEAVKSGGLKLADLSKGDYVSKKKYEDDLSGKDSIIADLKCFAMVYSNYFLPKVADCFCTLVENIEKNKVL